MGSKFLPGIGLTRIVEMTAEVLAKNGAVPGGSFRYNEVFEEPIGISGGKRVCGLCVRLNGRHAHAYPVDETES